MAWPASTQEIDRDECSKTGQTKLITEHEVAMVVTQRFQLSSMHDLYATCNKSILIRVHILNFQAMNRIGPLQWTSNV